MLVGFSLNSCQDFETDLEVKNDQNPSSNQLGIDATAMKIFQNWYFAVNAYNGPGLALTTMADMGSCSWGNAGMKDLSSEPRVHFDNRPEYGNSNITEVYFNALNAILTDANSLMSAIKTNKPFDDPKRTEAIAKFGQAISIGYLALVFDRVWLSDETGSLNDGKAVNYKDAMAFALKRMDEAIQIAKNNEFTIPKSFTNTTELSNVDFGKFLNSMAARLMVNNVRNSTERDALDWNKVLTYANNGITSDFNVAGDGWESWINEWAMYSVYPGWGRVDMRVIALMDDNFPNYWTEAVNDLPETPKATSADKRLETDFAYLEGNNFKPDRGIYHFSSYRHNRYQEYLDNNQLGLYPEYLLAENDLYKAEAQMRLGDLTAAAATINAGSRTLRGELPNVQPTKEALSKAIHYERSIELLSTGVGLGFFEMRRENLLQEGTLLHFPVPGAALRAAKVDEYTFGGTKGKPGEDYSNTKGWRE